MLDDTLPKDSSGNKIDGVFALFVSKDKKIISSTNDKFEIGDILQIDEEFYKLSNGEKFSKVVKMDGGYYAVGARCSSGYREYKSSVDDYKNDVLSIVFIYIGKISAREKVDRQKPIMNLKNKFMSETTELATFYIGNKFLAVKAENVIESIGIEELQEAIDMDKTNPFKGMVIYKEKLVAVLDIRDFIKEDINNDDLTNIILLEYDKDNVEHCIGILVSSLEHISVVEKKSIQEIQSHFLGTGTLVESLVDIGDYEKSQVAMLLNIKKIDDNLTKKV